MTSTDSENIAHYIFKKNYAKLGGALRLQLPVVVAELYSSSLILPGTKDMAVSDATTPSHNKALSVLDDIEGRLKTDCGIFEKFLDILSSQNVGLSHLADPMRSDYQQLRESSCHRDSKLQINSNDDDKSDSESSEPIDCLRRMDEPSLFHDETPKEARPKHLQFIKFPEMVSDDRQVETIQEETSDQARSCIEQGSKHHPITVKHIALPNVVDRLHHDSQEMELLDNAMGAFKKLFESVQESRDKNIQQTQEDCEVKVGAVKEYYEQECNQLKMEMDHADRVHELELSHLNKEHERGTESLMHTVQLFTTRCVAQEKKLAEMEKELCEIHEHFTLKSQEVDELCVELVKRKAELAEIKTLMDEKEDALKHLNGSVKPCFKSQTSVREQQLLVKVSAIVEIQNLVSQFSECHLDNLFQLKCQVITKIEGLRSFRRSRSQSL